MLNTLTILTRLNLIFYNQVKDSYFTAPLIVFKKSLLCSLKGLYSTFFKRQKELFYAN